MLVIKFPIRGCGAEVHCVPSVFEVNRLNLVSHFLPVLLCGSLAAVQLVPLYHALQPSLVCPY